MRGRVEEEEEDEGEVGRAAQKHDEAVRINAKRLVAIRNLFYLQRLYW